MMLRDDRAAMRRLIDRLADEVRFDIVHADQLNMAQYAVRVPDASKVLDAHNALWLLYKRLWETMKSGPKKWLLGRDWRLIKLYEGEVCREFDAVLAVSSTDQAALYEAIGEPLEITVIPIAVDVDEVAPIARRTNANHILHIGTMYWPPNIDGVRWFVDEVYPRVRAKRPDVCLDVIGANPPKDLMDLNQKEIGIRVTGYVDDPTPFLEETGVMVVPVRAGGGMRVKILNAMAQGLPIVTTTLGCEGIAVESGLHLLIADTPDEFAQAILYLLSNPSLAAEMGDNGRKLVQATYDYRVVCQKIDDIYRTVIE